MLLCYYGQCTTSIVHFENTDRHICLADTFKVRSYPGIVSRCPPHQFVQKVRGRHRDLPCPSSIVHLLTLTHTVIEPEQRYQLINCDTFTTQLEDNFDVWFKTQTRSRFMNTLRRKLANLLILTAVNCFHSADFLGKEEDCRVQNGGSYQLWNTAN